MTLMARSLFKIEMKLARTKKYQEALVLVVYSSNSFEAKLLGVRGSLSSPYLLLMQGMHLQSIRLTRSFMSIEGGFSAEALRAVTLRRIGCVMRAVVFVWLFVCLLLS